MFVCLCVNWVINYSEYFNTNTQLHTSCSNYDLHHTEDYMNIHTQTQRFTRCIDWVKCGGKPHIAARGVMWAGMTEVVSIYHLHVIIVLILSAITGGQKSCFVWQSFSLSAVNWTKTTSAASRTEPSELWEVWKCCKCLNCCTLSNPRLNL